MALPTEIIDRVDLWETQSVRYMIIGFGLLGASILASAAVSIFTDQLEKKYLKLLGFIAAVSTALLTVFNPIDLAFRFRDAWHILDLAVLRHNTDSNKYSIEYVLDTFDKGQSIIAGHSRPGLSSNGTLAVEDSKPAEPIKTQ